MAVKKNFITVKNKTYDVHFRQDFEGAMIHATFYEVKRPHRKRFGRTKFLPAFWGAEWLDDYDTIEELLKAIVKAEFAERERDEIRNKKFEEFANTP